MNSESSSWEGKLSAYLFPRGKVTFSHQTPPHCLGPSLKVPGAGAAILQERQVSAGCRLKDTAAPEAHPQSTPLSHTAVQWIQVHPWFLGEQEWVKKEAAN